ncbi:MAG: M60 family metallopeptidase [Erysipelotrichaceae bacterium]|nr:M60 family metallopeptidase [Erysipelotrichaceae bacterium]
MKKLLSVLLAFMMVLPQNVHATTKLDDTENENTNPSDQPTTDYDRTSGNLYVSIDMSRLWLSSQTASTNIQAVLSYQGEDKIIDVVSGNKGNFTLSGNQVTYNVVGNQGANGEILGFEIQVLGLPQGNDYTLAMQGKGFVSVSKSFHLQDYSIHLGMDNESVFMLGDVNEDGAVNDQDYDLLLANIGSQDVLYDLNRDGIVDIVDLSYLHQTLGNRKQDIVQSNGSPIIQPSSLVTSVQDSDSMEVVKGNLQDLFVDGEDKTVEVALKDETAVISEETPISVDVELPKAKQMSKIEIVSVPGANQISKGVLSVVDENGTVEEFPMNMPVTRSNDSSVVIDLGKQVAVKKVTITITGTKNNTNLAEIAKVEFINDVYQEIPKPESSYPKNVTAQAGDEQITVSWNQVANVTGYEVSYSYVDPKTNLNETKTVKTDQNTVVLDGLTNFVSYEIRVQSTADGWESGYGESVTAMPIPATKPDAPDYVEATGGYRSISVSWKKMDNTTHYSLYYKKESDASYQAVHDITTNTYTLMDLEDDTTYSMYVTGHNAVGESPQSLTVSATTSALVPTITPKYNLINTMDEETGLANHIAEVTYPAGEVVSENSSAVVDDDESTYWALDSWDAGGYNNFTRGPIAEFDQAYQMSEFVIVPAYNKVGEIFYAKLQYWDAEGNKHAISSGVSVRKLTDVQGKVYYRIILDQAITAKKVQINTANYTASGNMNISEIKYYYHDSIKEDIANLFVDDLRIQLTDNVTMDTIDALDARLEAGDNVSGEKHPDYTSLKQEIQYARDILNDAKLTDDIITVDQNVSTANDGHLQFAADLSDAQPLGIAVKAGDELSVYVGMEPGAKGGLELVFTQYYAEASKWQKTVKLNKGKNIITVPQIVSTEGEKGGSVYIRYTSARQNYAEGAEKAIRVRVGGGTKIPYLDVTNTDETTAKQRISTYLDELKTYTEVTLPELYASEGWEFNSRTSVYNVTEIMTNKMLLSFPADKTYETIVSGLSTKEEQIERVYQNTLAMEQMAHLAYAQKGLTDGAEAEAVHRMPDTRLNIRYHKMFAGAFMYAGGRHIGIEFDSVPGVLVGRPYTLGSNGKMEGGSLYGWGIAHEIGHVIDQKNLVHAEVTNNITSLFAGTIDDATISRIGTPERMQKIYKKVTSGATGPSIDVFTQLGMYWQLHLAYDDEYNAVDNTNTFYAKLHKLYRESSETASSRDEMDNLFIRRASDVVQKDLSEYFMSWGMVPNAETLRYLAEKGYPKETRKIQYISEEARWKRIENMAPMASDTSVEATLSHQVENGKDSRMVDLTLNVSKDADKILGYEIIRNGEVVGFTTENTYKDVIGTANNRVFTYEVVAYDYLLNKTAVTKLDPIKISHDGSMAKTNWNITSNVDADQLVEGEEAAPTGILSAIDDNYDNVYEGEVAKGNVELTIDLSGRQQVAGFKYTAAKDGSSLHANNAQEYSVSVSNDNSNWTEVATGSFDVSFDQPTELVYFGDKESKQLKIYDAQYVKLTFKQQRVALAEIDVIAPPGDNIDFIENGIGILEADYVYDKINGEKIPAGSLVFNGKYRGNPAFNAILLFDEDGNIVTGGVDEEGNQVINGILLATLPENEQLGDIADGNWIYWIEPGNFKAEDFEGKTVTANLYRVDNAETNAGQRLVSDTLPQRIGSPLPTIRLEEN